MWSPAASFSSIDSSIPLKLLHTDDDAGDGREEAGDELVMPSFISAPHVRHAAYRLRALRANPDVAITIETDSFPPQVVSIVVG